MDNFDIIIETQEPTPKQLSQHRFMVDYQMFVTESQFFKETLLRILRNKIDFSSLTDKEFLLIKYKQTGHKIDYSTLKNKKIKAQIRRVLENSNPILF